MSPSITGWQHLNVAITGMNNRPDNPGPGYAVARCLREWDGFQGHLLGLGYDALDGGLYNRQVCDAGCLLPYPSNSEEALFDRISALHQSHRIDVLIPNLDAEMGAMVRLQPRLEKLGIRMLLPAMSQLQLRNKERLPELCEQAQVDTPRSRHITDPGFFERCMDDGWRYPLVVKGRFYDAQIAHSPLEARAAFTRISREWGLPLIVQEFIDGEEYNLAGLGDGQGNLLGSVMMRKQALTEKGKGWAGTSIHHPQLLAAAQRLVKCLNWRGPLEIEMLRDKKGRFQLVEINPRFPAWIYLSHGAGCNLPVLLLQALTGELPEQPPQARPGVMFIRYAEDLIVGIEQFAQMTALGSEGLDPAPDSGSPDSAMPVYADNGRIS